jgi:Na+-transporting methylmalonyl-CoA/oxaloacetate decarboxylase gamma subunit
MAVNLKFLKVAQKLVGGVIEDFVNDKLDAEEGVEWLVKEAKEQVAKITNAQVKTALSAILNIVEGVGGAEALAILVAPMLEKVVANYVDLIDGEDDIPNVE